MEILNALTSQVNNRTYQSLLKEQIRSHLNGDEYLVEMLKCPERSSSTLFRMELEPRLFLFGGTREAGVPPEKHSESGNPPAGWSSSKFQRSSLLVKLMNCQVWALCVPRVKSVRLRASLLNLFTVWPTPLAFEKERNICSPSHRCVEMCVLKRSGPTNSARTFLFSTPSPAFIVCRFFDDGHSDWCEVTPHCSFDLHFSND